MILGKIIMMSPGPRSFLLQLPFYLVPTSIHNNTSQPTCNKLLPNINTFRIYIKISEIINRLPSVLDSGSLTATSQNFLKHCQFLTIHLKHIRLLEIELFEVIWHEIFTSWVLIWNTLLTRKSGPFLRKALHRQITLHWKSPGPVVSWKWTANSRLLVK